MIACWTAALAKVKKTLRMRQAPMLALAAAFCFVIMMFNVPIPGGTTGHATGAVLVAILLGPWAACIAVSLAIIIQALLFADGGILAIGANCFNIGVIMPFVGWWIYRLIAGSAPAQSVRHRIGGAVAGYLGLTVAAVVTGIQFGLQPLLRDEFDRAMYAPFGLHIAVPIMALEHLLVFGFVEALVTGLVIAAFQRTAPEMIPARVRTGITPRALVPRIALALGILVVLTPLGLYLPEKFQAGAAWGEWSAEEIQEEISRVSGGRERYIPAGLQRAEERGWKALLPGYNLPGKEEAPLSTLSLTYILSGAIGVIVLGFLILLAARVFARKDEADVPPTVDARPRRT